MENERGEFYSNGYCTAANINCENNHEGACGICQIGGAYRKRLALLKSPENDLTELVETLKT